MEEKCEYCDKLKDWSLDKIEITLDANLCKKCIEKMLLMQICNLARTIKEQLAFQKEFTKKNITWVEKMFSWMKKTEEDTNEGEEWKNK
ncbi:MAG: hypothetical protein WAX79_01775 [Candidatus Omnitrophota bacterium]